MRLPPPLVALLISLPLAAQPTRPLPAVLLISLPLAALLTSPLPAAQPAEHPTRSEPQVPGGSAVGDKAKQRGMSRLA